jgi:hypothetical protein
MRSLVAAALVALALAGCGYPSNEQRAAQLCPDVLGLYTEAELAAVAHCRESYVARAEAQAQANENAAAMMLMGATAFTNGYNNGQSGPLPMVNQGGRLTIYSGAGGMWQGY